MFKVVVLIPFFFVKFKEISYQKPREPIVRVIEFLEEYQKSQQLKSRKAVFKAIATAKF